MARARVVKHRFGGAMRQAGIVAAAGLYALEHNVARLADDHVRARMLAEGWASRGLPVDLAAVETNFVQVDVGALGLSSAEATALLARAGVGLSGTATPGLLRAVTHLDIGDAPTSKPRSSSEAACSRHVSAPSELAPALERSLRSRQTERLPRSPRPSSARASSSLVGCGRARRLRGAVWRRAPRPSTGSARSRRALTAVTVMALRGGGQARPSTTRWRPTSPGTPTAPRASGECSPTSPACSARRARCS